MSQRNWELVVQEPVVQEPVVLGLVVLEPFVLGPALWWGWVLVLRMRGLKET